MNEKTQPLVLVIARESTEAARRCSQLAAAGCTGLHAADISEAIEILAARKPGLVLLVPPLRDLPGVNLPEFLRKVEPGGYLPVLVQIDGADGLLRTWYFQRGADGVISGETSAEELAARVHALLRVKELNDQLSASRKALQQSLQRERNLLNKLKRDNANLQRMAATDALTRVTNVRSFRHLLDHEFRMAHRYNHPLSLLVLDVDHFKLVNDLNGHPCGDFVLKELAVILKRAVRASDVVARTGGEEFGIILPKADARRCAVLAGRVRREVAAHVFQAYGRVMQLTVSIGSATYPCDAEIVEPRMLVYLADQALLWAKESGRDRVVALGELEMSVRRRLRMQYECSCGDGGMVAANDAVGQRP